jgi:ribosomal protein S18 acetylase RimI-like enzyme
MAPDSMRERARAWRSAGQEAVCDVIEPWAHGTIVRATRYPSYYDYNTVRVEDEPGLGAGELAACADRALAGLGHRRLDFDVIGAGEAVRAELVERGWRPTRLLWMRHEASAATLPASRSRDATARATARATTTATTTTTATATPVVEVPYDAVLELRVRWHEEDFGRADAVAREHYRSAGKEVAMGRGARVLAAGEPTDPIAFAQLERIGSAAEVAQVYVHPDHRGRGVGTALTRAAIAAAGDAGDLWIRADEEDRAKDLYARLGFRPVWTSMEFLLLLPLLP